MTNDNNGGDMEKILKRCLTELKLPFRLHDSGDITGFITESPLNEYLIGYDHSEGKYFVCGINRYGGGYWDPPTEEVIDLYVSKDRYKALYALKRYWVKDVLEYLKILEGEDHE